MIANTSEEDSVSWWRRHRDRVAEAAGSMGPTRKQRKGLPVLTSFLRLPFLCTLRLQSVFKAGLPYSVKILKDMLKYVSPR